jgi:hypothetical protein
LVIFGLAKGSWAEIVPSAKQVTWQGNVGVSGGIPARTTICSTINAGASLSTVQTALNNCPAGQTVKLSAGTYNWSGQLVMPSNVTLRGAGPTQTIINSSQSRGTIIFKTTSGGNILANSVNAAQDTTKGATTLVLNSLPSWLSVGYTYGID